MSEEIKIITLGDIFKNIETEEKAFKFKDYIKDLQQKVKQLEKENEYLKMSNPEQNMEHFRIVNENKRKIDMLRKENHQLEKEVNKYQKELEKADSITQSCIFQGKQESKISFRKCLNRLEQLENIRKEAIEYLEYQLSQMDFEKDTKAKMLGAMTIVLLNKGDNKE